MKISIALTLICISFQLYAQEISIHPNGIILPSVKDTSLPIISTPGHLLYNSDHRRTEIFTSNYIWEGISSAKLIDEDGDTQVFLEEGLTQGSEDHIQFKINNTSKFSFQVNAAKIPQLVLQGGSNTFIGASSGRDAISATHNIAIGSSALANNVTADYNVAIGSDAMKNLDSDFTNAFGNNNVAIGAKSLENIEGFSGNNVAIGYESGASGGSHSVFLGYQAGKGASNLDRALYINDQEGDDALIYGEFDQGKVVINSNGGAVEDALLVNGNSAVHGPMRVKVDGATKFRVHNNGGLSIGTHAAPFDNGLKVANLDEAGPPSPLYADDRGNVIRRSGMKYVSIGPMNFEREEGIGLTFAYEKLEHRVRLTGGPLSIFAPISLPHGATIQEFRGWVNLSGTPPPGDNDFLESRIRLIAAHYTPQARLKTQLAEFISPGYRNEEISNEEILFAENIGHIVDNRKYHYYIEAFDNQDNDSVEYGLLKFTIGYEY